MQIGATLDELIEGVQLEIGHSTNPAVGVSFRETIAARIRREYRRLHADFDWPHLLDWQTEAVAPGDRYVDLPDGVELDRLVKVYHRHADTRWEPLRRTLGVEDYNEIDSDEDERDDPARKWRPKGTAQIEVWPIPDRAGQLRYVCKAAPASLIEPDDTCDLDTDVLVLFASATLLFKAGKEEAGVTLQRARNVYEALRQRLQTGANKLSLK